MNGDTWEVGDTVTCERDGFKPRQFIVTSRDGDVTEGIIRTISYTVRAVDGQPYWERAE